LVLPTSAGLSLIKVIGCALTLVGVVIAIGPRRIALRRRPQPAGARSADEHLAENEGKG
jgi:hypothetical protein